jgi:protein-S-isoprenylcysteine O-methyltransferase Ste14
MIGELNLDGVFVSSVLVSALIALAISMAVRRLLAWSGAYRFVWHPALFDTALFIILWAAVVALPLPSVS